MKLVLNEGEVFNLVDQHVKSQGFKAVSIKAKLVGMGGDLEFDGVEVDVIKDEPLDSGLIRRNLEPRT